MRKIVKVWRERNPYGTGQVWCLRWSDGKEEYTMDSASGRDMFLRRQELHYRRNDLSEELLRELESA